MKRLALLVLLMTAVSGFTEVVRLAPNFTWDGAGKTTSLRSLQGQPVVLLVAKSARDGAFRSQVKKLKSLYQEFAGRQVVFAAALREDSAGIRSDIPFILVRDGAKVAADYGISDSFNLIVIGKDGNVDLQTEKVSPASRVRDVIVNSFTSQASARK